MDWMPSRPSTTLPPYFLMGFSACSAVGARSRGVDAVGRGVDAVGARSDGIGGANACVAHSKYAATMRMIPLRLQQPARRQSLLQVCEHAFDATVLCKSDARYRYV